MRLASPMPLPFMNTLPCIQPCHHPLSLRLPSSKETHNKNFYIHSIKEVIQKWPALSHPYLP